MSTHVKKHSLGNIEDHSDGLEWTSLKNSMSGYATLSGAIFTEQVRVPTLSSGSWITTPSLTSTNIVNTNSITTNSLTANGSIYANNIEYLVNKTTDLSSNVSNTYYPTTSAVKTYVDLKDAVLSGNILSLSTIYVPYDNPITDVNLRDKTLFVDLLVSQNDLSSSIDLKTQTIYDNTSAISFEWTTRLFKDSQEVNSIDYENRDLNGVWTLNGSSFASSLTSKIDTVPSAVSGDLAVWNASGGLYDSSLPLSSVLILDNLGQIDQMRYLPSIFLKNKTPSLTAFCHEIWVETNENNEDYIVVGTRTRIDPTLPITFTWTGLIDGNLSDYRNYSPKSVPTSVDIVILNDSMTTLPSIGTLTCSAVYMNQNASLNGGTYNCTVYFNDSSYNNASIETGIFNDASFNDIVGTVTNGTFNGGSHNYGAVTNGTFNDSSDTNGTVANGTFYPTSDGLGGWTYTVNNGTVDYATCYWLEVDNALGGTITNLPVTYLDYPPVGLTYDIVEGNAIVTGYGTLGGESVVNIPSTVTLSGTTYNVTSVGDNALSDNQNVTEINFLFHVSSLGNLAFSNCYNLTNVNMSYNTSKPSTQGNSFQGITPNQVTVLYPLYLVEWVTLDGMPAIGMV